MKAVNFVFVSHCHQPPGTEEEILRKAWEMAYLPFLERISAYRDLKFVLHYSGFLLKWLCDRYPEFVSTIKGMVERGQVELLSGGMYEPILSAIPREDAVGQIRAMSSYIEERFGIRPKGAWLAERVWEPQMVGLLSESGIEYTLLDDHAFAKAGLEREKLFGRYVLEDQGAKISAYPINEKLRYMIPFDDPSTSISYLLGLATPYGERIVVFADDGEKYGLWPGTYEWVYGKGWLERFLEMLQERKGSIRTIRLMDAMEGWDPWGIAYIPPSSYFEMSVWSLPSWIIGRYEGFVRELEAKGDFEPYRDLLGGGMWRGFLTKYPESNNMHKRMLEASEKLRESIRRYGEREDLLKAREKIWMSQINCPYWHGVFGGVYLPHLRASVYRNIIEAESAIERIEHGKNPWIDVETKDFNLDGFEEICARTESMNIYISPIGGQVYELDYKEIPVNLVNTIARRYEAYHDMLKGKRDYPSSFRGVYGIPYPKSGELPSHLSYDWYMRRCFVDHFLAPWTDRDSFSNCTYGEQGDFVDQKYSYGVSKDGDNVVISLERKGHLWIGQERKPVTVSKLFLIRAGHKGFWTRYLLTASDDEPLWFGVELNISLSGFDFPTRAMRVNNGESRALEGGDWKEVSRVELMDSWLGIQMELYVDPPSALWAFPLETISQSEEGMEKIPQSFVLLLHWKDIPGKRDLSISWIFKPVKG